MTAAQIKQWRTTHGVSQERLAELLQVGSITVSRWERGIQTAPAFLSLALETLSKKIKRK
jgi:DNA-binding transcriptional regulator YiaG